MSIIFNEATCEFTLATNSTEYVFAVESGRYLVHRFYGDKACEKRDWTMAYHSFSPYEKDENNNTVAFNDRPAEFPFWGNGDFRCEALKLRAPAGDCCTRFLYKSHEIMQGRVSTGRIPCARATDETETLAVTMTDDVTGCTLVLYYTVFPEFDIISRSFRLTNGGEASVKIEKAMSLCLDLPGMDYDMLSLYGAHVAERMVQRRPLGYGNQRIMSRRGASSHQFNPFMALVGRDAAEESGDVYAFNFVWSGNFLDEAEVSYTPRSAIKATTRVCIGLGEENFGYTLDAGEEFISPEAIMLYTSRGLGDMSRKMHAFVRKTIVPAEPFERRPVVLNSWEAVVFKIDEKTLIDFAKEAQPLGVDMLVMDDGWFGARNHDRAGLGDWYVNREKFPDGLKAFAERIKATGVKFGIWIEPEMVNPDSDLYRAHPDWCISCAGRAGSLSRSQLILDMANPDVLDYLKKSFSETFKDVPIDYIKWDFNRHMSEPGSPSLPAYRQDEAPFRFMLGVYDLYRWFIETYPGVMIENCSGGGGRYDLAMMAVSTQIWTSDNTGPAMRNLIQYGSLIAYPAYVMSCHVSNPMHSQNPMRYLDYKFKVAMGGMLGYELNILNMPDEVKEEMKAQIGIYRRAEELIKHGDLYRLISPFENEYAISAHYYTNGEQILLSFTQNKGQANPEVYTLKVAAADENATYRDYLTGEVWSGASLREGVAVTSDTQEEYGRLWLFERV